MKELTETTIQDHIKKLGPNTYRLVRFTVPFTYVPYNMSATCTETTCTVSVPYVTHVTSRSTYYGNTYTY